MQCSVFHQLSNLNAFFSDVCVMWTVEHDLDQIDYIDSCTAEEEEDEVRQPKGLDSDSLSSQFMAYIEQRRVSHEVVHVFKPHYVAPLLKVIYGNLKFCPISNWLV